MAWFQSPNIENELMHARNAMLADNWWVVALRGVLAILFGIAAFAVPAATMLALVLIFAAYSLIDGICSVVLAVHGARTHERWGWLLLNGLCRNRDRHRRGAVARHYRARLCTFDRGLGIDLRRLAVRGRPQPAY